jgi:hypothetical protein
MKKENVIGIQVAIAIIIFFTILKANIKTIRVKSANCTLHSYLV